MRLLEQGGFIGFKFLHLYVNRGESRRAEILEVPWDLEDWPDINSRLMFIVPSLRKTLRTSEGRIQTGEPKFAREIDAL